MTSTAIVAEAHEYAQRLSAILADECERQGVDFTEEGRVVTVSNFARLCRRLGLDEVETLARAMP